MIVELDRAYLNYKSFLSLMLGNINLYVKEANINYNNGRILTSLKPYVKVRLFKQARCT